MNKQKNDYEVNRVSKITELLYKNEDIEKALRLSLTEIVAMINAESGLIWRVDKKNERVELLCKTDSLDTSDINIRYKETIIEKVVLTGMTYVANEEETDKSWKKTTSIIGIPVNNMVCVPISYNNDIYGCLQIINKTRSDIYTQSDIEFVEMVTFLISAKLMHDNTKTKESKQVLVSLRDVKKEYITGSVKTHALNGINLDIYKGEFVVILGKSGCGKSTLLNIIGGMDTLTEGRFFFEDEEYTQVSDKVLTEYRRKKIGFVFQSYNLMPELTAKQNLDFIAALCDNPNNSIEMLNLVGLGDRIHNYPAQLSGGQQQRVSIARALVKAPQIILADEPTAALDHNTSIEVLRVIETIVRKGATMIMVTHNEEIARMADRIVRIKDGVVFSIKENDHPCLADELDW